MDRELRLTIEREMMAFRSSLKSGAPLAQVEQQAERVESLLKQAQERLSSSVSAGTIFTSSLLILLREGLEAILLLAAIFAFVVKTKRRDALPYVHAGWVAALALGVATWFAANFVVDISGADREVTEGVTALLAAAMLIYVGLWLHSKAYAQRWQQFIREQVGAVLEKKTLRAMAAASFLAVYREMSEIVLFYQALWAQAGAQGRRALWGGIAAAAVALAALGWGIFKYSMRLPIGAFFAVTSVLIALLAVVFAGQGVAALQEAGKISADAVAFVRIPALGIFPTAETLLAQLAVLAIVIGGFYLAGRSRAQRRTER
ncbi:MAG: FTR1 family protein [Pseudomonadota bacterium]